MGQKASKVRQRKRSGLRKNPRKKRHSSNWLKFALDESDTGVSDDDELFLQYVGTTGCSPPE